MKSAYLHLSRMALLVNLYFPYVIHVFVCVLTCHFVSLIALRKETKQAGCFLWVSAFTDPMLLLYIYLSDVRLSVSHSSISCEYLLADIYSSIFIIHSDMPVLKNVCKKPTKKARRQPLSAVSADCVYESWLGPAPCLEKNQPCFLCR